MHSNPDTGPRPETIELLREQQQRAIKNLPTAWVNCRNCDGAGCGFCDLTGSEPTFQSAEARDRYYGAGGDYLNWPGI